ncbi:aldehyde dehydrogenase family protein [Pontiella agarivorans]|uniref:Aldehyde dehydrogenase family protein n=1 Tax=Pontiella agarivorans TaxID=3038953 RepID=A0ABU5MXR5_9BACT|nr:aldehyde dehydrogenase family protein [Pontiella agarivorans]MDZ8118972.1 aldehyde dehydrogenase family protein [Pontiella agarivorans]
MSDVKKMFIDGEWVEALSGETRESINPANGEVLSAVAEGAAADVDKAVEAAKEAFYNGPWGSAPAQERAALLFKLADLVDANAGELAELEMRDNGKPLRETEYDVADTSACFRYYAGLCTKPMGQTYDVADPMQAMTVREPIGVVGLIVPWNYPLLMATWKIAPALAAGNCIIFKPAELTPLSAVRLFELIEEAGFPKGVANLVMGAGPAVGARMAEHPDIDKIAFTGGTATGRKIMTAATGNLKKISLELGGKSPCVVFEDADMEAAVDWALFAIFANQGQVCSAGSRLLLQESIHDEFVEKLVACAEKIKVAPGDAEGVEMAAMISEAHMEKVLRYIEIGKQEGATLRCGGMRLTEGELSKGFFVAPTVFTDTTPDMRIVQEEIFGPVLVVQKFTDDEDAVRLANDSIYGLAGGVFSENGARALNFIKKLRAGITWINCYHPTYSEAPWGGYKQSGIGRDLGTYGFDEYTEVKQININLEPGPVGWFEN